MIRGALGAAIAILAVAALPTVADGAEFGIPPGSLAIRTIDGEGNPDNRAGAHPDRFQIDFGLSTAGTGTAARDLVFELPPGIASDADAVPVCPREVFEEEEICPSDTQVGVMVQSLEGEPFEFPVYNLEAAPAEVAAFGAKPLWKVMLPAEIRSGDFGLTLAAREVVQLPLGGGKVELWGIPADHQSGLPGPRRAFLTTPTRCEPLEVTFRTRSWQPGAPWLSETAESEAPLGGCNELPFEPTLGFSLSTSVADSPTGTQLELTMPQNGDPDGRVSSQIKNMSIEFPDGLGISPAGAEGRSVCSDVQFALGEATPASCPSSSRVGSVKLESPQLREALDGDLYLGAEHPGERFRLLVLADGPGVAVKLASVLRVDPATGRLTVVIDGLPQVPIGRMSMSFDGGPHALLATPLGCGSPVSIATFEPYAGGPAVSSSVSTPIVSAPGLRCSDPTPFAPSLTAGSTNPVAGRLTPFSLTMQRRDGEQLPSRFAVVLPRGLSAAVGTVSLCPNSSAAVGTCASSSRVGSAVAELGPGTSPAVLRGEAYLTASYRRAPFGLSLVFPARVGPFDLGTFVVRAALRLDRRTGQVTIETDSLPALVEGVPFRIRTIGIDMDRPGFTRNPTSCEPSSVDAQITAVGGATATATSPFSLTGCRKLGFKPKFSLALADRSELHEQGKPSLTISTRLRPGHANLRMMKLSFPKLLRLDLAELEELCSHGDAARGKCAAGSRLGSVYARTPILGSPLRGGLFVAQPEDDDGPPDLWLSLAAMGVHVDIRGESSNADGHFAMKLAGLPDLPLSVLRMRLPGGEQGVFSLDQGLCVAGRSRRLVAPVVARGQDGAYRQMRVRLRAEPSCRDGGRR